MEIKIKIKIEIYIIEEVEGRKRRRIFTNEQDAIRHAHFLADKDKKCYFISKYEENELTNMIEYVLDSVKIIKPKSQED